MIWEMWQHFVTKPQITEAKKMGYLKESIAMSARAKRCQKEWGVHYQFCQNAILEAVNRCVQRRTALIFGAGTLQDIPIAELAKLFDKVILVDLVFLNSAYQHVKSFDNVELVEHDVTESLAWLSQGQAFVQNPTKWLEASDVDLVVSLNIITQLPLIPVRWLMTDFKFKEDEVDIIGKQLIFAHMNYLKQFQGEVCLIADREDVEFNRAGKEIDRFDPWWDVEPPQSAYTWQWEVVPFGEGAQGRWQKNTVGVSFL